ncbi:MAG: hypothetical protein V1712_03480 [Patescibacteria group bacterium]
MFFKLIGTVILSAVIFNFCFWQINSSNLHLDTTQQMALAAIVASIALVWLTIFYKSLSFVSLTYGIVALALSLWSGDIITLVFSIIIALVAFAYLTAYTNFDRFVMSEVRRDLIFRGQIEAMVSFFIITVSSKYINLL